MTDEDWTAGFVRAFTVRLAGDAITERNGRGEPIVGNTLLLFINAHHEPVTFTIPLQPDQYDGKLIRNTAKVVKAIEEQYKQGAQFLVQSRTMVILGHATSA